jgi:DNA-binding IclR family transcriptional regulator
MVEQNMMINPMSPQRAAVLAALQQAGRPMRPMEIAAATGMKYSNVANMLLRMRTDGQTEHAPCGRWQLTAHGTLLGNQPERRTAQYGALAILG